MVIYVLLSIIENILQNLRKSPDDKSYRVPYGGAFKYVSSGNYASELLEWLGYFIATNSPAALAMFLLSCSTPDLTPGNLVPRAATTHQWYLQTFNGYPQDRKRIIPFIY